MKKQLGLGMSGLVLLAVAVAGRVNVAEPQSSPQDSEFLSQVRYIITSKEKKDFRALPDSEKPRFITEFWERRDPDSSTVENEFKVEYFKRIESANQLFSGEGRPGWLTDRGRIYILFGPPASRAAGQRTGDTSGRCEEVWQYGRFPVIFVDPNCNGSYILETLNLQHLHDITEAQAIAQNPIVAEKKPQVDFDFSIRKNTRVESRVECLVEIEIPVRSIWFSSETGKFTTTFDVAVEVRDKKNAIRWQYKNSYPVAITEEELKKNRDARYRIEIPFTIDTDVDTFRQGKNKIQIVLKNQTGNEELRKTAEFTL